MPPRTIDVIETVRDDRGVYVPAAPANPIADAIRNLRETVQTGRTIVSDLRDLGEALDDMIAPDEPPRRKNPKRKRRPPKGIPVDGNPYTSPTRYAAVDPSTIRNEEDS